MTRYGMVIDLDRCIGCHACVTACTIHHGLPKDIRWSHVYEKTEGTFPQLATMFLPSLCMQCENPLCMAACPQDANFIDEDGVVQIDLEKCIGCGMCVEACPYHARTVVNEVASNHPGFDPNAYEQQVFPGHIDHVVEKCTFCNDCRAEGEDPWCVRTCMAGARYFGDLDDPESQVAQLSASPKAQTLLKDKGTNPKVFYLSTSPINPDDAFGSEK